MSGVVPLDTRTMRRLRTLILVGVAAALLAAVASSPARAAGPSRTGTIVGGIGETPVSLWVRGADGCVGAPTCAAWLQSACHPDLAEKDPAVHASIVDVESLADGVTERVLDVHGGVGINWGYVVVQFWTETTLGVQPPSTWIGPWEWCGELFASRVRAWECRDDCRFRIPVDAKWMTITSSPDNTNITWALS